VGAREEVSGRDGAFLIAGPRLCRAGFGAVLCVGGSQEVVGEELGRPVWEVLFFRFQRAKKILIQRLVEGDWGC